MRILQEKQDFKNSNHAYVNANLEWEDLSIESRMQIANNIKSLFPNHEVHFSFPVIPLKLCVIKTGERKSSYEQTNDRSWR